MKYLLPIFLLVVGCSSAQNNIDTDQLSKYSYLILGYVGGNVVGNGTGFFIKKNGEKQVYFVTAYHAVTGVNLTNKTINDLQWDFLKIRLFKKDGTVSYHQIRPLLVLCKAMCVGFTNNTN